MQTRVSREFYHSGQEKAEEEEEEGHFAIQTIWGFYTTLLVLTSRDTITL